MPAIRGAQVILQLRCHDQRLKAHLLLKQSINILSWKALLFARILTETRNVEEKWKATLKFIIAADNILWLKFQRKNNSLKGFISFVMPNSKRP